jgi:hypothetical protein
MDVELGKEYGFDVANIRNKKMSVFQVVDIEDYPKSSVTTREKLVTCKRVPDGMHIICSSSLLTPVPQCFTLHNELRTRFLNDDSVAQLSTKKNAGIKAVLSSMLNQVF